MKAVPRKSISVKKYCSCWLLCCCLWLPVSSGGTIQEDTVFAQRAAAAIRSIGQWSADFHLAAARSGLSQRFLEAIVFPEVLRYSRLRDGLETESLRTLYVQLGADYADFSIGLFQMKPSFAETVEQRLTSADLQRLQLGYTESQPESIRLQRVQRLQDPRWQLRYLTAFVLLCREICRNHRFISEEERMQWYALLYNGGLQADASWIRRRIAEDNRYLAAQMPGHRFRYAALATWYYRSSVNSRFR